MDRIRAIIEKQLQVSPLELLQVQNHIYGCFILMEDIVGKQNKLQEYNYTNGNYTFNIDEQFSEIGIRYGFLMDTKLIFDSYLPEYKATWLEIYKGLEQKTIEDSDRMEDDIIDLIKNTVAPEMAFFLHALQTGSLPQEWLHKVILLLTGKTVSEKTDTEEIKNGLAKAAIEKEIKRFRTTKRQLTQGTHSIMIKKPLAKTRRAIKFHGLKI